MDPTHLLFNADVRVLDRADRRATAIAWRGGNLLAVGSNEDVRAIAGSHAVRTDARGATVLPGFIDAHQHPGLASLYESGIHLTPPDVVDIASLQARLAAAARDLPDGQWLVATGWDESLLAERRPPTRAELDEAVPNQPLFAFHYSYHRAAANSRALEAAGIGKDTPNPPGGHIDRGRGGLPNGLLVERAMSRVESLARASLVARDAEAILARLRRHHQALAAAGITRVVDAAVTPELGALYRELARRGELLVPTVMMPVSVAGYLDAPWDRLDGPATGSNLSDAMTPLMTGPLKLFFDGAPTCAMCLSLGQSLVALSRAVASSIRRESWDPIRASLSIRPRLSLDGKLRSGLTFYEREEASAIVAAAIERGFAVASHAEGNDATARAVAAYEAVSGSIGRHGTPRIEHALFVERDLLPRIAALGCACVVQPSFLAIPAFADAPAIPGLPGIPIRWLLDAGVTVAGSSDYPVVPFDPLDGVRRAVTRATRDGVPYEPEQAITLDEALVLYTRSAADAAGCLDRCGTLEPGKRADVVVLNRRLTKAEDLADTRVTATVIGGRIVAGALGSD